MSRLHTELDHVVVALEVVVEFDTVLHLNLVPIVLLGLGVLSRRVSVRVLSRDLNCVIVVFDGFGDDVVIVVKFVGETEEEMDVDIRSWSESEGRNCESSGLSDGQSSDELD